MASSFANSRMQISGFRLFKLRIQAWVPCPASSLSLSLSIYRSQLGDSFASNSYIFSFKSSDRTLPLCRFSGKRESLVLDSENFTCPA
ncbi:unnamed protein product [Sphagnum balticum]